MTDRSVPVGDRDAEPAVRPGPAMAREALAEARPPTFVDQVLGLAAERGWAAATVAGPGPSHHLFVRDGRMVAAWMTSVPIGFAGDEWRARLNRVPGVTAVVLRPKDGLGPAEHVLAPRRTIDPDCGQPGLHDRDAGPRGD